MGTEMKKAVATKPSTKTLEVNSEQPATYNVTPVMNKLEEDAIIAQAWEIIQRRARVPGSLMDSPDAVKQYLTMANAQQEDQHRERFSVLFLDSQNCVIEYQVMFIGTLTATSVYPREIVRHALTVNAAAVILSHNHPSGALTPSRADEAITQTLKTALALIEVRVLDHIITAANGSSCSMAEKGLV